MKFCQTHWDALRAAIAAEGLDHLVARDGHAAIANMVSELETGSRRENFDPLMAAHWAIVARVMEVHPEAALVDGCPLCYAKERHATAEHEGLCPGPPECTATEEWFEGWIPSVAEYMRGEHERMRAEDAAA